MRREEAGSRARLRRACVAAVAVAAVAVAAPASGQELHALVTGSYSLITTSSSDGASARFSGLSELLDANWNAQISPLLGYRLTLRAQHADGSRTIESQGDEISTKASLTWLEPRLELSLSSPGLSVVGGFRLQQRFTDETGQESYSARETNPYLRLTYSPEGLPSLALWVEQLTRTDTREPQTIDEDALRLNLSLAYALRGWTFSYSFQWEQREDNVRSVTNTQANQTGAIGYQRTFFDNRLSVQADVFLSQTKTEAQFSQAGFAEISRTLAAGLRAAFDATPEDSADVPVTRDTALVTGGAAIPLALWTAIGFSFATPDRAGLIQVSLAADAPFTFPTNFADFVGFRVFATDDPALITWKEVAGVAWTFDTVQNRLSIVFPTTTARSFKVWVSRNDFGAIIRATRIEAPIVVVGGGGTEVSQTNRSGTLNLALSYTPVRWLTASYNANLNVSEQDPDSIRTTSGTQTLGLQVRPHSLLTITGTAQHSFSTTDLAGAEDSSQLYYTLVANWIPLPTLTTTLTLSRSDQREGDDLETRIDTIQLSAGARVYPGLTLDGFFTFGRGENFETGQETIGEDFSLQATAQLTTRLSLTGNYAFQHRDVSPTLPGQDSSTITHALGLGLNYTLSRLLNLSTRWDYVHSSDGYSLVQSYKVDWAPTSRTSLYVLFSNTIADRGNIDTLANSVSLNWRWILTRVFDVNTSYTYSWSRIAGRTQEAQALNATANFRF